MRNITVRSRTKPRLTEFRTQDLDQTWGAGRRALRETPQAPCRLLAANLAKSRHPPRMVRARCAPTRHGPGQRLPLERPSRLLGVVAVGYGQSRARPLPRPVSPPSHPWRYAPRMGTCLSTLYRGYRPVNPTGAIPQGSFNAVQEWAVCRHVPLSRRARGLTSLQREMVPAPHPARAFPPSPELRHTAGGPDRRRWSPVRTGGGRAARAPSRRHGSGPRARPRRGWPGCRGDRPPPRGGWMPRPGSS